MGSVTMQINGSHNDRTANKLSSNCLLIWVTQFCFVLDAMFWATVFPRCCYITLHN